MYDNLNPAIHTYEERAIRLNGCHFWLCKAKNSEGTNWEQHDKIILTRLDTIISTMSHRERDNITERVSGIIRSNALKWKEEYDKQFLEALVEVLGYGWLRDKFPSQRVQFEEPPDLVVRDDKCILVAAMACKRMRTSDTNDLYFEQQRETGEAVARSVDTMVLDSNPAENPLLRKLQWTLSQAKKQLKQVVSPTKFIFLSVSFDVSAAISRYKPVVIRLLEKEASNLGKNGITVIAFENFQAAHPFILG